MTAHRRTMTLILLVLVPVLSVGVVGCSGMLGQVMTTSSVSSSSAASTPSVSGETPPGDASASTTVPGDEYSVRMRAWVEKYLVGMDTSALNLTDPLNASSSEVSDAKGFASRLHAAVSELKAITPTPQMKALQSDFVAAVDALSAAVDAYVLAMASRKNSDLQQALALWTAAQSRLQAATSQLTPRLGVETPT